MNVPVVWDGSYHFPLPNGEVIDPSFLPSFIDCDGVVQVAQDIPGAVVDSIVIPQATFLGAAGTSKKIADLGGGVFTYESSFGTIQEATDLVAMMNALIADPVGWAHEIITQGGIVIDWPHGSITNPIQNANAIQYTLNVPMAQITPAPASPYLTNPPPSDFTLNKAAVLAAYQSQPIGQVYQGADFTMELHTQVASAAVSNAYQFVTCDNLADALAALADNQVISSPNNTISVGASGPQAPDNQVDYKIDVNYVAGTTPAIVSDTVHPDAHSGKNTSYMGTPDTWIQIPWAASPTGFLVLPGYFQA